MKSKAHTIYKLADGTRVPGVTTIVGLLDKPALVNWANKLGLAGIEVGRYVDDKADIGTLAHDMVVCHLLGKPCGTDDYSKNQISQAQNAVLSFFAWAKSKSIKVLLAEQALISEQYRFGGTFDLYCEIDGIKELLDLKTGSGIYPEHVLQVAGGYGLLLEENKHLVERFRILNIPRSENENWGELIVSAGQVRTAQTLFPILRQVYDLNRAMKNEVVYAKKQETSNEAI
jgi:hypothetical protein